jgi:hypothetical protein
LDPVWLFEHIADEVWITTTPDEQIPHPSTYPLYHTNLWRIWRWLRANKKANPTITPKQESIDRVKQLLEDYKVPEKFVTLQPLFDAGYNQHRNAPVGWWREVTDKLCAHFPVVLLGTPQSALKFGKHEKAYSLWDNDLSPMDSLALLYLAQVHAGGETGLSLWAAVFKRPTVAIYATWSDTGGHFPMDCRPLSCGAPVEWAPIGKEPEKTVDQVIRLFPAE